MKDSGVRKSSMERNDKERASKLKTGLAGRRLERKGSDGTLIELWGKGRERRKEEGVEREG